MRARVVVSTVAGVGAIALALGVASAGTLLSEKTATSATPVRSLLSLDDDSEISFAPFTTRIRPIDARDPWLQPAAPERDDDGSGRGVAQLTPDANGFHRARPCDENDPWSGEHVRAAWTVNDFASLPPW